jgi:hypothetical protein
MAGSLNSLIYDLLRSCTFYAVLRLSETSRRRQTGPLALFFGEIDFARFAPLSDAWPAQTTFPAGLFPSKKHLGLSAGAPRFAYQQSCGFTPLILCEDDWPATFRTRIALSALPHNTATPSRFTGYALFAPSGTMRHRELNVSMRWEHTGGLPYEPHQGIRIAS